MHRFLMCLLNQILINARLVYSFHVQCIQTEVDIGGKNKLHLFCTEIKAH